MEKKELIGRKVRGFMYRLTDYPNIPYDLDSTLNCIGLLGYIVRYDIDEDWCLVHFPGTKYGVNYPASLIVNYLVEEPKGELKKGDYVRGFKFESNTECTYMSRMDDNIGKIGKLIEIEDNRVLVEFQNGEDKRLWLYPKDEALEHRAGNNDTTYTVSDLKFDYGFYKNEPKSDDPLDNLPLIGDGVLMEVSHDGIEWNKRYVLGKRDNYFFAWDKDNYDDIWRWKHARPMPKTKITRKEFESKFEIID